MINVDNSVILNNRDHDGLIVHCSKSDDIYRII